VEHAINSCVGNDLAGDEKPSLLYSPLIQRGAF
jgi:hypothetical protein